MVRRFADRFAAYRGCAMNRSVLFCLLSALVGGLAATAWHQTGSLRQANAQQPSRRDQIFQPPVPGTSLPPSTFPSSTPFRAPAAPPALGTDSSNGFLTGLEEF